MVSKAQFEEQAIPHMQAAFNLAYWIVRSREDAEDVVQDAYVRAYRSFADLRGHSVKPWLFAIVRNAAYRCLQNRRRAGNVILFSEDLKGRNQANVGDLASQEPSAEAVLIAATEQRQLSAALGELSVDFREVIVLREIEGLSYNEIAQAIDAPIGTVMSRLSRARAELRESLARRMAKDESDAM